MKTARLVSPHRRIILYYLTKACSCNHCTFFNLSECINFDYQAECLWRMIYILVFPIYKSNSTSTNLLKISIIAVRVIEAYKLKKWFKLKQTISGNYKGQLIVFVCLYLFYFYSYNFSISEDSFGKKEMV